jgi:hypothetical protein
MPDPMMYQEDAYVLLESGQPEQLLTAEELLARLVQLLSTYRGPLPRDLQRRESLDERARHLRDTYCEFDVGPDRFLQWYVVRLEK